MSLALLEARSLGQVYGSGTRALDQVTLRADRGEFLALLGKNGAGKTTFLRLAFGLNRPTTGEIHILGELAHTRLVRGGNQVAGLGENWEPPHWTTPNVLAKLYAGAGAFNGKSFENWCGRHGLDGGRSWGEISKGQKRWVLCGLALAREPELLLLDEPADGLDPVARKELFAELRSYADKHAAAVIITTHILADVERTADRVAILERGQLVLDSELETLREEVREVEFPLPADTRFILEGVQVLGRRREAEVEICTVRSSNLALLEELADRYKTSPVDLDGLFTLVTNGSVTQVKEGAYV